ncbi:hypothetical protein PSQ40_09190 [Curvibacter sp. HBC61]|uniref:Helix-turn-helix domain-containing protein n=1 Tax=Curvibacter cyanobacteriorum TaxID=3026422 RepID=A0ABT5MY20_9BURK|nr:hypothetical protein [Curvibacter sp. HBC61]MDD0838742.1 hypothetical protein [Curvibacter sp. HBC61]
MTIRLSHLPAAGNLRDFTDAIHRARVCDVRKAPKTTMPTITNDLPEAGCGGASAAPAAPVAASSDDHQPEPDPEPRRPSYRPVLITFSDLQELLRLRRTAVHELSRQVGFPVPIIVGRSKRWIRVEVDQWIEQRAAARKGALK